MRIIIYSLSLLSVLWSQVSVSDLNKFSNNQLDLIREELQNNQSKQDGPSLESNMTEISVESLNVDKVVESPFFGYDYFEKDISFFDNIPTPLDYRLGPGDEVVLSLWGETNQRKSHLIDKNGMIFFDNIGFVNISNQTIQQAEKLLIEKLSQIYSTLKDKNNPTNLTLELGKIKSINVYFTGEVNNPGINLIHPFSDVFSALVQAGGVDKSGSLRNVSLIRNNKIVEIIDFYSFFTSGKGEFQKVRIIDGDIIHIPTVKKRVEINGEIKKEKSYELLDSDTLSDLIQYAGGLKSTSSNKAVVKNIIPIDKRLSDDIARSGLLINLNQSSNLLLSDGAIVKIIPVADNDFSATIYGRVNFPGEYPIYNPMSFAKKQISKSINLKELLDLAGGFDDPIFRKSIDDKIVVLRLDENQFYSKEFNIDYSESENFTIEVNDKIFVYENSNYKKSFSFEIRGEVLRPGSYPFQAGQTLEDAISLAGGINESGSLSSISVSKLFVSFDQSGNIIPNRDVVSNVDLNFSISNNDIITISKRENVIRVSGNVYNPGLISLNKNSVSLSRAIELAGGFKPYSLKKNVYVVRSNGEIEKAKLFRGRAKRVFLGDSVFVPLDPDPQEFDITSFFADLSSTLANIAAILIIADND